MRFQSITLEGMVALGVVVSILAGSSLCFATDEWQRKQYIRAEKALSKGDMKRFHALSAELKEYPLYPYLVYQYLNRQLWKRKAVDVQAFLEKYDDLPVANTLRKRWLKYQAKRQRWGNYLAAYVEQPDDPQLQCYYLLARLKTGATVGLMEDASKLWRVGKSQPSECDPVFSQLYRSELMTADLVLERIRLSIAAGELGLAKYLANYLAQKLSRQEQLLVKRWIALHRGPAQVARMTTELSTPLGREVFAYGLKRWAKRSPQRALDYWEQHRQLGVFSKVERSALDSDMALIAAQKKYPDSIIWLNRITTVTPSLFRARLKVALHAEDWRLLERWTQGEPPEELALKWNYWRARALEKTSQLEQADKLYRKVAQSRDYYGFLAADRLREPYSMNNFPLEVSHDELNRVMNVGGIQRAYEFYQLVKPMQARLEWLAALARLEPTELIIAASIAHRWKHHYEAILTLGKARTYDDLVIRFPILYESILEQNAIKNDLDISFVFGLVRAESLFVEDARSPAGARGLMQVMPQTGKRVARQLRLRKFNSKQLYDAEVNVPIGTKYMSTMLVRYQGNQALAAAAYNAGPSRVKRWLDKTQGCQSPDVWIEQIPFTETRKYVRRVLFYSNIYAWRLQAAAPSISARMGAATSAGVPCLQG